MVFKLLVEEKIKNIFNKENLIKESPANIKQILEPVTWKGELHV